MPERIAGGARPALAAVLWLLGLLSPLPAAAHKLKVFATADGDRIQGSAYFAGGSPAAGATILIQDAEGAVLAHLSPDKDGHFSYQAQTGRDHVVVARTDDGHEARWRIGADELAAALARPGALTQASPAPEPASSGALPQDTTTAPTTRPPATTPGVELGAGLDPRVLAAIEQAVARQVRPLREELNAAQDQIRLHDILGGIGYILGLTGLALWLGRRGQARRP